MSYFIFDWAFAFLTYKILIATNLADVVSWLKLAQTSAQILHSQRLYRKTLCWEGGVLTNTDTFLWTNLIGSWISQLQSSSLGEIIRPVQRSLGNLLLFLLGILWWELVLSSLVTHYSQPGGVCRREMAHLCLMREQGRAEGWWGKNRKNWQWSLFVNKETARVGPRNVGIDKMEREWEPLLSSSHTDWLGSISSASPSSTPWALLTTNTSQDLQNLPFSFHQIQNGILLALANALRKTGSSRVTGSSWLEAYPEESLLIFCVLILTISWPLPRDRMLSQMDLYSEQTWPFWCSSVKYDKLVLRKSSKIFNLLLTKISV